MDYPQKQALRSRLLNKYDENKKEIVELMKKADSKIAFTIDGWSSVNGKSFYGITAHFLDADWVYHSLTLDFVPAKGEHTGKAIAELFFKSVEQFGFKEKIAGITVDNASANTTFMQELSDLIPEFDSVDCHFRCLAHVLNLAAQDLLKSLNLGKLIKLNYKIISN